MKRLLLHFDDETFYKLKIKKGSQTWDQFLIQPYLHDSTYDINIKKLLKR